jgi:hypothetical protein
MVDALKTASLPQYQSSAEFMERFLDAVHEAGAPIHRARGEKGAIKLVDGREITADALDYFSREKFAMETEFADELHSKIGAQKTELFCGIISTDWYDGRRLRHGPRVRALKQSVRRYLEQIIAGRAIATLVVNDIVDPGVPCLTPTDIAAILTINDQMLTRHIEAWKAHHPDSNRISNDDIFFRRGLSLDAPRNENDPYREWDFINSYSIALSAPENFSQMQDGRVPALVSGDLVLFSGRVLFFSPFMPNMDIGQLEAGVIPSEQPLPIKFQGSHGGILEYVLGERPEDMAVPDSP